VKCTHGATIGQIEGDALFYLRSRGIDELCARKLLLFAFASECLDRMKQGPVRKHVEGLINRCLFQMANSAPGALTENRREDTGRNWGEIA
jgi:Fe-S cluster assembly protein SufD